MATNVDTPLWQNHATNNSFPVPGIRCVESCWLPLRDRRAGAALEAGICDVGSTHSKVLCWYLCTFIHSNGGCS